MAKDDEKVNNNYKLVTQEILRDMYTIFLCFKIQEKVKNPLIQELYGYLMVFFYSVFMHEMYQAGLIIDNPTTEKPRKLLRDFRQRFLKQQAILGKPFLDDIREEMGIDFEHFTYDMVLTVEKRNSLKLYVINLSFWDLIQIDKNKLDLFNSIAGVPEKIIRDLFGSLEQKYSIDEMLNLIDTLSELAAMNIENEMHPQKYPYASAVFFKNPEPCDKDKYLILYYYSYFSLMSILDNFVPEIKIGKNFPDIDMKYSLLKLKAMFIEVFGDFIKNQNTPIVQEIKTKIENQIGSSNVFVLNRRLRNNIHYKSVNVIVESEITQIDEFQKRYFELILEIFDKRIRYRFGRTYRLIKWIADHTDSKILE